MKNLHYFIFVAFFAFATLQANAQSTHVPDANFRQALTDLSMGVEFVGEYATTATISGITSLNVSNKGIIDLTGIEDFVALTDLYCFSNNLSQLDLSKNSALKILNCTVNQLSSLDVTKNTALTILHCYDNQLVTLDVSKNKNLDILNCKNNLLTTIDARNGNNENITVFNATNNTNLTTILVDDKFADCVLSWLQDGAAEYYNNESDSGIDYSHTKITDDNFLQALKDLGYGVGFIGNFLPTANISEITSLDVSNKSIADLTGIQDFIGLKILKCHGNDLLNLNISANTALEFLDCEQNRISTLDLSKNAALITLNCGDNKISSLDLSKNIVLDDLVCYENLLSYIDIRNGNNKNVTSFFAVTNPDLRCIYVDDTKDGRLYDWKVDATAYLVNNEAECSAITSIEDINTQAISVFPNPTNEIMNIDFSGKKVQKLMIFDVMGKIVFEKTNVNLTERVDISFLTNGLYILTIQMDKENSSYKIIKE